MSDILFQFFYLDIYTCIVDYKNGWQIVLFQKFFYKNLFHIQGILHLDLSLICFVQIILFKLKL